MTPGPNSQIYPDNPRPAKIRSGPPKIDPEFYFPQTFSTNKDITLRAGRKSDALETVRSYEGKKLIHYQTGQIREYLVVGSVVEILLDQKTHGFMGVDNVRYTTADKCLDWLSNSVPFTLSVTA